MLNASEIESQAKSAASSLVLFYIARPSSSDRPTHTRILKSQPTDVFYNHSRKKRRKGEKITPDNADAGNFGAVVTFEVDTTVAVVVVVADDGVVAAGVAV